MMRADILTMADAGESVEAIAAACDLTRGRVYTILRKHRPGRSRQPRRRTSSKPDQVRALCKMGTPVKRAAELLGVTRQYAYRCAPVRPPHVHGE